MLQRRQGLGGEGAGFRMLQLLLGFLPGFGGVLAAASGGRASPHTFLPWSFQQ